MWKELKNIFTNKGLDVFIDNTGNTEITLKDLKRFKYGKLILVGVPRHDEISKINTLPLHLVNL